MAESQKNAVIEGDQDRREVKDEISLIFTMIKEMCDYRDKDKEKQRIEMSVLAKRIQMKGFSQEALQTTLQQYSRMNVL